MMYKKKGYIVMSFYTVPFNEMLFLRVYGL